MRLLVKSTEGDELDSSPTMRGVADLFQWWASKVPVWAVVLFSLWVVVSSLLTLMSPDLQVPIAAQGESSGELNLAPASGPKSD